MLHSFRYMFKKSKLNLGAKELKGMYVFNDKGWLFKPLSYETFCYLLAPK